MAEVSSVVDPDFTGSNSKEGCLLRNGRESSDPQECVEDEKLGPVEEAAQDETAAMIFSEAGPALNDVASLVLNSSPAEEGMESGLHLTSNDASKDIPANELKLMKTEVKISIDVKELLSNPEDSDQCPSKQDATAMPPPANTTSALSESSLDCTVVQEHGSVTVDETVVITASACEEDTECATEFTSNTSSEDILAKELKLLTVEDAIVIATEEIFSNTEDSDRSLSREDERAITSITSMVNVVPDIFDPPFYFVVECHDNTTADDTFDITVTSDACEVDNSPRKGLNCVLDLGDKTRPKPLHGKTTASSIGEQQQDCHDVSEGSGMYSIVAARMPVSSQHEVAFNAAMGCERDNSRREALCCDLDLGVETRPETQERKKVPSHKEEWQKGCYDEEEVVLQDAIVRPTSEMVVINMSEAEYNFKNVNSFLIDISSHASGTDLTCDSLANESKLLEVKEVFSLAMEENVSNTENSDQLISKEASAMPLSVNKVSKISIPSSEHLVPGKHDNEIADNILVIDVKPQGCKENSSLRTGFSCDIDLGLETKSVSLEAKTLPSTGKILQQGYCDENSGSSMYSSADTRSLHDSGNKSISETTDICERDSSSGKTSISDLDMGVGTRRKPLERKMFLDRKEEWQQNCKDENEGNTMAVLKTPAVCEIDSFSRKMLNFDLDLGFGSKPEGLQEKIMPSSEEKWQQTCKEGSGMATLETVGFCERAGSSKKELSCGYDLEVEKRSKLLEGKMMPSRECRQCYQEENEYNSMIVLETAGDCSSPRKMLNCDLGFGIKTELKPLEGKTMQGSEDERQEGNHDRNGGSRNGVVLETAYGGSSPRKVLSSDLDLGVKRKINPLEGKVSSKREEEVLQGLDDKYQGSSSYSNVDTRGLHANENGTVLETTEVCVRDDSRSCFVDLGIKKEKPLQGKMNQCRKEEWQQGYCGKNGGCCMDRNSNKRILHDSGNEVVFEAADICESDSTALKSLDCDDDLGVKEKSKPLQRKMILNSSGEWNKDNHDNNGGSIMNNNADVRKLYDSGNEAIFETARINGYRSVSCGTCIQPSRQRKKRLDLDHQFVREIVKIQHDREHFERQIQERQASGHSDYKDLNPVEQHYGSYMDCKSNLRVEAQEQNANFVTYSLDKQMKEPHMSDVQKRRILSVQSKPQSQCTQGPVGHNIQDVPVCLEEQCKRKHRSVPIDSFPDASHKCLHKKEGIHDIDSFFDLDNPAKNPSGRHNHFGLDSQVSGNTPAKGRRYSLQTEAVDSLFGPCNSNVMPQSRNLIPDCANIKVTVDTHKHWRHIEFVDPAPLGHPGRQQKELLSPRGNKESVIFVSDIKQNFHSASDIVTWKGKSGKQREHETSLQGVHPRSSFSKQPKGSSVRSYFNNSFNGQGKMVEIVESKHMMHHASSERSEKSAEENYDERRLMKQHISPEDVNITSSKKHLSSMKTILTPFGDVESRKTLHASKMQEVGSPDNGCEQQINSTGVKQHESHLLHLSEDVTCFPAFKATSVELLPGSVIKQGDSDASFGNRRTKRNSIIRNKSKDYTKLSEAFTKDRHSSSKAEQAANRIDRYLFSETSEQDRHGNIAAEKTHNSVKVPCAQFNSLQLEESIISTSRFSGRWADATDDSPDSYDLYKARISFTGGIGPSESFHPSADSKRNQRYSSKPEVSDTRFDFESCKDTPQHILRVKKQNLNISSEHVVVGGEESDMTPNHLLHKVPVKKNVWEGSKIQRTPSILGPAPMASISGPALEVVVGLPVPRTTTKSVERGTLGATHLRHHFTGSVEASDRQGETPPLKNEDAKTRSDTRKSREVVVQAYKDKQKRSKRELYVPRRGSSS